MTDTNGRVHNHDATLVQSSSEQSSPVQFGAVQSGPKQSRTEQIVKPHSNNYNVTRRSSSKKQREARGKKAKEKNGRRR